MKARAISVPRLAGFRDAAPAIALVAGLLAASGLASAHHSNAMFDKSKLRQVTVTVKEFQWTNPHVWIQVYLENDDGEREEWSIEGGGPNTLFRNGWRPNSFKPGDVIEIKFNPMHDGSKAALFVGVRFSNGETLGNW
jgi:hypothetical protein